MPATAHLSAAQIYSPPFTEQIIDRSLGLAKMRLGDTGHGTIRILDLVLGAARLEKVLSYCPRG